ncbi:MAG: DJ-1/PfpI family protein [Treponema sp.]|nr:DJ-1/PfpI family protein [Treponema sp.]
MEKTALVLLAEGFEEVEAVTPIDYMRRAGIAVTTVAIGDCLTVKGARGIAVNAEITLKDLMRQGKAEGDAIVIPGGIPGAQNIAASGDVGALIAGMAAAGKLVCAICASPVLVLGPLGILAGKSFTCYPGMEEGVQNGKYVKESVVVDGNIVTSRGAGTSGLFSVAIIGQLLDKADGERIAKAVLL